MCVCVCVGGRPKWGLEGVGVGGQSDVSLAVSSIVHLSVSSLTANFQMLADTGDSCSG